MQKKIFFLALCFFPFLAYSQSSKKLTAQMQAKYPNEKAVYLTYKEEVTIDFEGDSIRIISHSFHDMLHLSELSKGYAQSSVSNSSFTKSFDIKAYTLAPYKSKYKTIPVSDFVKKDDSRSGIFYDDSEVTSFSYPSVSVGSRTVLDYKQKHIEPKFSNPFYFASYLYMQENQLVLNVHKDIEIEIKEFNIEKIKFEYSKEQKGDYITYTWTTKNAEPYKYEENSLKGGYFLPHLIYYIKSYTKNDKNHTYLSGIGDLYDWYYSLTCTINQEKDSKLQKIVNELVSPTDKEMDKVRKVFYWVQDNIKYIAFENGMQGFIPDEAGTVSKNRYGDCKGMASITHQMLNMAGVESHLTWIGTRRIPYKYSEVPTPMVDNHMIVTYQDGKKNYFLDATSSNIAFGMPSSMIQGKEALISKGKDKYEVATVPIVAKEKNTIIEKTNLKLAGKKIIGKGNMEIDGYPKSLFASLEGLSKEKEKKVINAILTKGNNKFLVNEYQIANLKNKDKPLRIDYQYSLQDYAKLLGDEIYINLNLDKRNLDDFIDIEKRKYSISNSFQSTSNFEVAFELPTEYEIDYLPENQKFDNEFFGFAISYQLKDQKVYQTKKMYSNNIVLKKENFEAWNEMITKLSEAYREVVILKKK